jgi:hypothetical protein
MVLSLPNGQGGDNKMKRKIIWALKILGRMAWRAYAMAMILLFGLILYTDFIDMMITNQPEFTKTIEFNILCLMMVLAIALAMLRVAIGSEAFKAFFKKPHSKTKADK